MRRIRIFREIIFLVALVLSVVGCVSMSPRETPIVRVVREYAPAVVNISTETVVDLKKSPECRRLLSETDCLLLPLNLFSAL